MKEETDLTKVPTYVFRDNAQAVPDESAYLLPHYAADAALNSRTLSVDSPKIRIEELTIVLQKQTEQKNCYYSTLQNVLRDKVPMQTTANKKIHQLEADQESLEDKHKSQRESIMDLSKKNGKLWSNQKICKMRYMKAVNTIVLKPVDEMISKLQEEKAYLQQILKHVISSKNSLHGTIHCLEKENAELLSKNQIFETHQESV